MGYYTRFSAEVSGPADNVTDFKKWLLSVADDDDYGFLWTAFEEPGSLMTWYNFDSDLKEISQKFPNIVIELYRDCTEEGDGHYLDRFRNGVQLHGVGEIVYPELNFEEDGE